MLCPHATHKHAPRNAPMPVTGLPAQHLRHAHLARLQVAADREVALIAVSTPLTWATTCLPPHLLACEDGAPAALTDAEASTRCSLAALAPAVRCRHCPKRGMRGVCPPQLNLVCCRQQAEPQTSSDARSWASHPCRRPLAGCCLAHRVRTVSEPLTSAHTPCRQPGADSLATYQAEQQVLRAAKAAPGLRVHVVCPGAAMQWAVTGLVARSIRSTTRSCWRPKRPQQPPRNAAPVPAAGVCELAANTAASRG
jgi:hypothetical protein